MKASGAVCGLAARGIPGRAGQSGRDPILQCAELLLELGQRGVVRRLLLEQLELPALRLEVGRSLLRPEVDPKFDALEALLDHRGELIRPLPQRHHRQQSRRSNGQKAQAAPFRNVPFAVHQALPAHASSAVSLQ